MHNFKKIFLHTLLLIVFVVALLLISMLPYFYGESYYYQDYKVRKSLSGKIDTLVVGSSHALRSIKPTILNEQLNINAYNLSSPLMSMYGRYTLLKKEIERNPIKNVFIELSYNALTLDREGLGPEGDLYVLGRLDNFQERIEFLKKAFTREEYYRVFSDTINRSKYALGHFDNKVSQYETYGYLPVPTNDLSLTKEKKKEIVNSKSLDSKIKDENLEYFVKFIELCKENNIRIILIVTPVTEKFILKYDNIDEVFSQYVNLSKKYACEYYDFNLDKNRFELYNEKISFYDETHMSDQGAEAFSNRLSQVMKETNENKDISNKFYESYDKFKKVVLK